MLKKDLPGSAKFQIHIEYYTPGKVNICLGNKGSSYFISLTTEEFKALNQAFRKVAACLTKEGVPCEDT